MKLYKYTKQFIRKVKKNIFKRINQVNFKVKEFLVFDSAKDKKLFHNLSNGKINEKDVVLINIKPAGKTPVFCRNNNSDHFVVHCTFFELYHLPPKKLKPNAIILDLGSNIGLTIRHLKHLYPDSKIIGVEMDHENYLVAHKNLNELNNCSLINAAIWYKDGLVNYKGSDPQSYYCADADSNLIKQVRSYSLTTLFREYDLSTIDFVKMDIEGAESMIFDNDCTWLNAVQSINIEVHNGEPLSKYISVLEKYGFKSEISKRHWSAVLAYK